MDNLEKVLKAVDFFFNIIDKSQNLDDLDFSNMYKIWDNCIFIENLHKKVKEDEKEVAFENNLNAYMRSKKKTKIYYLSDLDNACNKFLELCIKNKTINNSIIDELLKKYVSHHGNDKFKEFVNKIMTEAMHVKALVKVLENLQCSNSELEVGVLSAAWNNEIILGNKKNVIELIENMYNGGQVSKLIEVAYRSKEDSGVAKLLLEFFAYRLNDYDSVLFRNFITTKNKILKKFLNEDRFKISFMDATFYFGRNLNQFDNELSYEDIKHVILILLDGSEDLHNLTLERIASAKPLDDVWTDIEQDCVI